MEWVLKVHADYLTLHQINYNRASEPNPTLDIHVVAPDSA